MRRSIPVRLCGEADLEAVERDEEGFLLNADDWRPELIEPLAAEAGLHLTDEHRHVIRYIREYFGTNFSVPEADFLRGLGDAAMPESLIWPAGDGRSAVPADHASPGGRECFTHQPGWSK